MKRERMIAMKIQPVTTSQFDEAIAKGNVIIDFSSPWCGYCRKIHPLLEKAAEGADFPFYEVNCDEEQELAARFEVDTIPTVIFFKDGEAKDQFVGYLSYPDIQAFIEKNKG